MTLSRRPSGDGWAIIYAAVLFFRIKGRLPLLAVFISAGVLSLSAVFLYRWVNRLAELDLSRRQENLDAALVNFQREFAATLREPVWFFRPVPELESAAPQTALLEAYLQWKSTSRWPQILSTVAISVKSPGRTPVLMQFQPKSGRFEEQPWPAKLDAFRRSLDSEYPRGSSQRQDAAYADRSQFAVFHGFRFFELNGAPALALPVLDLARAAPNSAGIIAFGRRQEAPESAEPAAGRPEPSPGRGARFYFRALATSKLTGWCFLEFNEGFIQYRLLPFLVSQYFGPAALARYRVAVVTGKPDRLIYSSASGMTPSDFAKRDARVALLWPRLHTTFFERPGPRRRTPVPARNMDRAAAPSLLLRRLERRGGIDPASWQLVARDRAGSLAADVGAVRQRNLAIGSAALLLLAATIAALLLGTFRAHRLARRQMEFIAGISHELRTPLAVIESAAFNLAHGRVDERSRIQQYGEVIQSEGRRLTDLVEQSLSYSSVQSGRQRYEFKPIRVLEVIEQALSDYDALFARMGWQVEKVLESSLPTISADPSVLKSIIKNLIGNAVKYASDGKWLRVTARAVDGWRGSEVQITVADRGPGIDPADMPHIFEPFYRGRKIVASNIPGAGLGLSLVDRHVQAHKGHVSVRSTNGCGTEFALHLPAL